MDSLRSITLEGFKEVVNTFAPPDPTAAFTSHDLRKIFRGEQHHSLISPSVFHPKQICPAHYSNEKPDIAVTYSWNSDLRSCVPQFLEGAVDTIFSGQSDSTAGRKRKDKVTFWIDICFVDQRNKNLRRELQSVQKIYGDSPYHVVILCNNPLARGWCVYEIGTRCSSIMSEFKLSAMQLCERVDGRYKNESKMGKKAQGVFESEEALNRLPRFVACKSESPAGAPPEGFATSLEFDLVPYCFWDSLDCLETYFVEDKIMIQKQLETLVESKEKLQLIIRALASTSLLTIKPDLAVDTFSREVSNQDPKINSAAFYYLEIAGESLEKEGAVAKLARASALVAGIGGRPKDFKGAEHLLKPLADEKNKSAENALGLCLEEGSKDLVSAVALFKRSAEQLFPDGQYNYGRCLLHGLGVEKSLIDAMNQLCLATKSNHEQARKLFECQTKYELGLACELGGRGNVQSDDEARKHYEEAEKLDHADAKAALGMFYILGRGGLVTDWTKGMDLLRTAADRDSARAQNDLGVCHEEGLGGHSVDLEEAVKWYMKSSAQGWAEGQYNLGRCYHHGLGVDKDNKQAERLLDLALKQNNPLAIILHKGCVEYGEGRNVEMEAATLAGTEAARKYFEARKHYQAAAAFDNADAQAALGMFYLEGRGGLETSFTEASRLLKSAAAKHSARAQHSIGRCHAEGKGGFSMDHQQAVKWYMLSAAQGWGEAQYDLGKCYLHGYGVSTNVKVAKELLNSAALAGLSVEISDSTKIECYRKGLRFERKDDRKAREWYQASAAFGLPDAKAALGMFYIEGRGGLNVSFVEGKRLLGEAESEGCKRAQNCIGECYEKGLGGFPLDLREAVKCYKRAASLSTTSCMNKRTPAKLDGDSEVAGKEDGEGARVGVVEDDAVQEYAKGCFNLGRCYIYGLGVRKNIKEGEKKLKIAEKGGNVEAAELLNYKKSFQIGTEYELGIKMEQSDFKALEKYQAAAAFNYAAAQAALGRFYILGKGGLIPSWTEGAKLLHVAVTGKVVRAQSIREMFYLRYQNIRGMCRALPKDYEADSKESEEITKAENVLGVCCENGFGGFSKDHKEAFKWYTLAASHGSSEGHHNLGRCYEIGIGVEKNIYLAKESFQKARRNGFQYEESPIFRVLNHAGTVKERSPVVSSTLSLALSARNDPRQRRLSMISAASLKAIL